MLCNSLEQTGLFIDGEWITYACGGIPASAALKYCFVVEKNRHFLAGTNVLMRRFSSNIAPIAMGPLPYDREKETVCLHPIFDIVFTDFS